MEKQNKIFSTRGIAEIAIMTAIAFGLDFLQSGIWRGLFPNGGSIGLAMLPILILCYRRGFIPALISATILAFLQLTGGLYVISDTWDKVLAQILFDYILAYPVVAFAGLFYKPFQNATTTKARIKWVLIGSIIGGFLKFVCHYISGVVFWPNAKYGGPYIYSLVYNGSYMLPSIIICCAVMVILVARMPQFFLLNNKSQIKEEKVNEEDSSN